MKSEVQKALRLIGEAKALLEGVIEDKEQPVADLSVRQFPTQKEIDKLTADEITGALTGLLPSKCRIRMSVPKQKAALQLIISEIEGDVLDAKVAKTALSAAAEVGEWFGVTEGSAKGGKITESDLRKAITDYFTNGPTEFSVGDIVNAPFDDELYQAEVVAILGDGMVQVRFDDESVADIPAELIEHAEAQEATEEEEDEEETDEEETEEEVEEEEAGEEEEEAEEEAGEAIEFPAVFDDDRVEQVQEFIGTIGEDYSENDAAEEISTVVSAEDRIVAALPMYSDEPTFNDLTEQDAVQQILAFLQDEDIPIEARYVFLACGLYDEDRKDTDNPFCGPGEPVSVNEVPFCDGIPLAVAKSGKFVVEEDGDNLTTGEQVDAKETTVLYAPISESYFTITDEYALVKVSKAKVSDKKKPGARLVIRKK